MRSLAVSIELVETGGNSKSQGAAGTCHAIRVWTSTWEGTWAAGEEPRVATAPRLVHAVAPSLVGMFPTAAVVQVSASATKGERICDPGGLPGIKDQIDVTFTAGQVVRAYDLGGSVGKICYVGSWHNVRRLHQYLRSLMTQYYPIPFPNDRGKTGRASGRSIKPSS